MASEPGRIAAFPGWVVIGLKESIAHLKAFCSACERRKAKNAAAAGSAAASSSSISSREKREERREKREETSTTKIRREIEGCNDSIPEWRDAAVPEGRDGVEKGRPPGERREERKEKREERDKHNQDERAEEGNSSVPQW